MSKLSVVILCYRAEKYSEKYLKLVLKSLAEHNVKNYQVILVGNYVKDEQDETPKIIAKLANNYEKVDYLALEKPNYGWLGWDVRTAFSIADGTHIALIDGDGQMPANDIAKCFLSSKKTNADITMTYRKTRGDGLYRKTLSFMYNTTVKMLFPYCEIQDLNSKPKVIKRDLLQSLDLKSNGWTIDAEIMIQAIKRNIKVYQIPTDFIGQPGGRKSFVGYKAILEFIIFLLRFRIRGY
jgi:glycosyltransferase involved in cell wall biosynthesis